MLSISCHPLTCARSFLTGRSLRSNSMEATLPIPSPSFLPFRPPLPSSPSSHFLFSSSLSCCCLRILSCLGFARRICKPSAIIEKIKIKPQADGCTPATPALTNPYLPLCHSLTPLFPSRPCRCSPHSYDDVEVQFEVNDDRQQKLEQQARDSVAAAAANVPPQEAAGNSQSDDPSQSLACLRCQKRKSKCDHGRPCSICLVLGQDCTYSQPKKRGPKPGR
jgi:hypothetical protein